jgi:uncharacterized repeat protein (TIGR03803 family)
MRARHVTVFFATLMYSVFAFAQTESVLYSFDGTTGLGPYGNVVFDSAANLYGTTDAGGANGSGTVFELSPNGNGGWAQSVLYDFDISNGGNGSLAPLVFDQAGNLYGTTVNGGPYGCSCGMVFELSPNGQGWTEKALYSFSPYGGDGEFPHAGVTFDSAGNLYGTTYYGGANGLGAVFELTPSPNGWSEQVIYSFTGTPDGANPYGGLVSYKGSLYGTTGAGGMEGAGSIFELTTSGGGWEETVIHSFGIGKDGSTPIGVVTFDAKGKMYGTTYAGGKYGLGTVYRATHSKKGWKEKPSYSFKGGSDGAHPFFGSLVFDATGRIFGTTYEGGNGDLGTVFMMTPKKSSYSEKVLYSFAGGGDGASPYAGVVLDKYGNVYGTTVFGGGDDTCAGGCGTVFEVVP